MSCPACSSEAEASPLESWADPVEGRSYRVLLCSACGTSFSEPREAPGPDYYLRVHSDEDRPVPGDWRHAVFFEESPRPVELLDVGCGAGDFLLAAKARGYAVSGLDFNEGYVARARAAGIENAWARDFEAFFRETPRRYGVATLFDVLEHVPEPARFLRALRTCLRPGGLLAVSVPNAERPLLAASFRERYDYPPYHFTRWTARSLARALEAAGFSVLRTRCAPLHIGYFAGQLYYRLLNALFPLAKRLLLGERAGKSGRTWTDLLAQTPASSRPAALLREPRARQALTDAGLRVFRILLFPLEAPLILYLRRFHPERGRTLFVLARREG